MNIVKIIAIVLVALLLLAAACVIGFLLLLAIFYVFAVKGRRNHPGMENIKGHNYAHRGLHDQQKPENSMAAFAAALDKGYGIELDVHLTKDGELAVIHDHELDRCTGCPGNVEDMTLAQLQEYTLNGTQEKIPAFSQVLQLFDGKAPLIIELKVANDNYAQLTDRVMAELKDYSGVYCIESFDPRCLKHLKKNYPQVIRGQLSDNYMKSKPKFPWYLRFVMTYLLGNFMFQPDFIAYKFADRKNLSIFFARKLWKMHCVAWTVQTPEEFETAVSEGWIPIFEGFEP